MYMYNRYMSSRYGWTRIKFIKRLFFYVSTNFFLMRNSQIGIKNSAPSALNSTD